MSPLLGWECRVCSWSLGSGCSSPSAPLRDGFTVALLINSLCFPGALSRFADNLISLFSPLLPLPLPSVGSTSSSPALLGIREPRSEYDRTQPPMQYYNSQGDTTHKGLYPGKTPVGCVIRYLKESPLWVALPVSWEQAYAYVNSIDPHSKPPHPFSTAVGIIALSACLK